MPTWLLFILVFIVGSAVVVAVMFSIGIIVNGTFGTLQATGRDTSSPGRGAEPKALLAAEAAALPPGGEKGLRLGWCIDDGELDKRMAGDPYTAVSCGDPHDYEVYFVHLFPEGPYPGEDAMAAQVDEVCNSDVFWDYVGPEPGNYAESLYIVNIYALESAWNAGNRFGECLLKDPESNKLTGSMQGGSGKAFGWPSTTRN